MSSHKTNKVADALCEFETAIASGNREGAVEALATAQAEAVKAKSGTRASTTASATDADVVAACDSASAAVAAPPTRSTTAPVVGGIADDLWALFLQAAPSILAMLKRWFGGP
jgi:hypothetical protein